MEVLSNSLTFHLVTHTENATTRYSRKMVTGLKMKRKSDTISKIRLFLARKTKTLLNYAITSLR